MNLMGAVVNLKLINLRTFSGKKSRSKTNMLNSLISKLSKQKLRK
jgi:hypothetical protein